MNNEEFLTVQECAFELGISDGAVRGAILEGRLPFVTKYGRKLISRASLEEYKARTRPDGVKPTGRPKKK